MEEINFRVVGIDESRPPVIEEKPCIFLYFELNEAAPKQWCNDFQAGVGKQPFYIRIDPDIGLHIETWVRKPEQITKSLETVKALVAKGNDAHKRRLKAESVVVHTEDESVVISPEQRALNKVIAGLEFDAI